VSLVGGDPGVPMSIVLFRPGGFQILDSRGDLVCMVIPEGQVFRADFFSLLVLSVVFGWLFE
jgi:hypothetical protein